MKKIKLLSLFSGIGAFEKALDNIGADYELVNYCEIDRYASKAYAMIHECSEEKNLGDITKVDTDKLPNDIDILTYGFPCQDISLAGRQRGFDENGQRTRSGLFFEALRIIDDKKPRVAICENVKNLTSKKFSNEFDTVLNSLVAAGYRNYWKVLNAKDYGIPQNRERVFIVSIRKDADTGFFQFPQAVELERRVIDVLEDAVEEKYYMNTDKAKELIEKLYHTKQLNGERVCCDGSINEPKIREVSNCIIARYDKGISNQKQTGLCVVEPIIAEETNKTICINSKGGRNGIAGLQPSLQDRVYHADGVAPACTTSYMPWFLIKNKRYYMRIRKLIPLECWRLMGFKDTDFKKVTGISNTQLYKMAGNSIVVDVLENIFKEIFKVVDFESNRELECRKGVVFRLENNYQLAFSI